MRRTVGRDRDTVAKYLKKPKAEREEDTALPLSIPHSLPHDGSSRSPYLTAPAPFLLQSSDLNPSLRRHPCRKTTFSRSVTYVRTKDRQGTERLLALRGTSSRHQKAISTVEKTSEALGDRKKTQTRKAPHHSRGSLPSCSLRTSSSLSGKDGLLPVLLHARGNAPLQGKTSVA